MPTRKTPQQQDALNAFALEAAQLLHDRKCEDVQLLDVRGHSHVCDYVLIGSGTSERQMRSVAAELEEIGGAQGQSAFRTSRDAGSTWIVIDFVDIVVHLFEPQQRQYYDLETLWSDAARVDWRRPDQARSGIRVPS
jgi:ribosome-associated protein